MMQTSPEEVVDQAYFQDILNAQVGRADWVLEEIWMYRNKKHPQYRLEDFSTTLVSCPHFKDVASCMMSDSPTSAHLDFSSLWALE